MSPKVDDRTAAGRTRRGDDGRNNDGRRDVRPRDGGHRNVSRANGRSDRARASDPPTGGRKTKQRQNHPVSQDPKRRRPTAGKPPQRAPSKSTGKREPVRSSVEPQLLERRRQISLDGRNRLWQRLKVAGALTLAAAVTTGILFSPFFDIDTIDIKGKSILSADDITRISGLSKGSALVAADTSAAADALRADPWIAFATLRRSYPSTMLVTINEEIPTIVIKVAAGSALVSRNGRILEFASTDEKMESILDRHGIRPVAGRLDGRLVDGIGDGSAAIGSHVTGAAQEMVRLSEHLSAPLRQRLSQIDMGSKGDLKLLLTDGSTVLLGPAERMSAKVSAVESVLAQVDLQCLEQIDVRNPIRATVRRADGCKLSD